MSELLACNASDLIKGIASNAGGTNIGTDVKSSLAYCSAGYGTNSTHILLIHGYSHQNPRHRHKRCALPIPPPSSILTFAVSCVAEQHC